MKKILVLAAAAGLGWVSALVVGRWLGGRMLDRAALAARAAGESLREQPPAGPLEGASSEGAVSDAAPLGGQVPRTAGAVGPGARLVASPRPHGSVPRGDLAIGVAQVLDWARAETVPRARFRAQDALPAGLEIDGGAAFVAELEPGDRLIEVDGVPITDREQVVRQVLEARGRGQSAIAATFVRLTETGPARFVVTIQQPYDRP
ncbi:MAG TPA: hypothetical protein VLC09_14930 [Polyangiaceae bacterium]|nr:hypothetical protein [Polyangiaceae bacterium]